MLALGCNLNAICINQIHYVALEAGNVIIGCCHCTVVVDQAVRHTDVVVGKVECFCCLALGDGFPQEFPAGVDVAMGFCNLCRYSVVEVWRGGVFVVATGLLGENRLFTFSFSYVSGGNYDLCRIQSLRMRQMQAGRGQRKQYS